MRSAWGGARRKAGARPGVLHTEPEEGLWLRGPGGPEGRQGREGGEAAHCPAPAQPAEGSGAGLTPQSSSCLQARGLGPPHAQGSPESGPNGVTTQGRSGFPFWVWGQSTSGRLPDSPHRGGAKGRGLARSKAQAHGQSRTVVLTLTYLSSFYLPRTSRETRLASRADLALQTKGHQFGQSHTDSEQRANLQTPLPAGSLLRRGRCLQAPGRTRAARRPGAAGGAGPVGVSPARANRNSPTQTAFSGRAHASQGQTA